MAKRNEFMKIVAVLIVLLFLISGFSVMAYRTPSSDHNGIKLSSPNVIIKRVYINISNTANFTLNAPYQQIIEINNSLFQTYEAQNLQNIYFTYTNGTIIPSWLESGASEYSNLSVYWLKINVSLLPHSNLTIYMNFGNKSENYFNGINIGEAPQFSIPYGKYDDGKNVFYFYENFSGNQLNSSKWIVENASFTVNNGIKLGFNNNGYLVTKQHFRTGYAFDAYALSTSDTSNIGFFNISEKVNSNTGLSGSFIREACGNTYPDQWNFSGEANGCGNNYGYFVNKEFISGIFTVSLISNNSSIQYYDGLLWGTHQPINRNNATYPLNAGFNGNSLNIQWARIRYVQPNNYTPIVYIDGIKQNSLIYENGLFMPYKIIINVTPQKYSTIILNNQVVSYNGFASINNMNGGISNILITNPYYQFYFQTINITNPITYVNITLSEPLELNNSLNYPWKEIGPAFTPNPQSDGVFQFSSGHIGLIQINPFNPKIIYIASGTSGPGDSGPYGAGGVYETLDGGLHWVPKNFGLPYGIITSFYMNQTNPDQLLVGFWNSGIYETNDGGNYWYEVGNYTFTKDFIYVNGNIFAGSDQGVIESNGSLNSWKVILNIPNIHAISISKNVIYAFSTYNMELYRSLDLGNSWQAVYDFSNISYDVWSITASPWNSSNIFVCVGNLNPNLSNVWVSYDGGINFQQFTNVSYSKEIVYDILNKSVVFAYGPGYIGYSYDGGKTFVSGPQVTDNMGFQIDKLNDSIIIMGSDQGVYETNDLGKTWYSINGDLSDMLLYGLGVSSDGKLIIADMQDYSAWISHDGGKVWLGGNTPPIPLGNEGTYVYVNPYNSSWVYGIHIGGQLMVSNNSGFNFTPIFNVSEGNYYLAPDTLFYADPFNHTLVYVATTNGVYVGEYFGKIWKLLPNSPKNTSTISVKSPNNYLIGTSQGLYNLINGNLTKNQYLGNYFIYSIAVDPQNISNVVISSSNGLFISKDGGNSFVNLNPNNLPSVVFENYGIFNPPMLFFLNITGNPLILTSSDGIYISLDLGNSWNSIGYNINSGFVTGAVLANNSLYISTYGNGILYIPNFSVYTLPGTVIGNVLSNINVSVNGTPVNNYEGHFRLFLKPGNYTFDLKGNNFFESRTINVNPMGIYFINLSANVTFIESGLPSGTMWYVNLSNGQSYSGKGTTITFYEPNGTYSYTIATVNKSYAPSPSSGTFKVSGANVNVAITFNLVTYTITFTENGLPSGTMWYVNLSNGQSYSGKGTTITFYEPNGTYSYTIATVNKSYAPSPSSGTFKVSGANVNVVITFNLVTYTVTFTESGLPTGTMWYVNLSNGQSYSGTGTTITFNEPNGTYSYTITTVNKIYAPSPSSGTFTVNGANVNVAIKFILITYTITFTENGLPSGTLWSVTLNNITKTSTNATITFNEPNGTYTYSIKGISGYRANAYSGTINVNGNSVGNSINWTIITYPITITENGIPNGTSWYATLTGTTFNGQSINVTLSSRNNTITFYEPNGTYAYTIHLPSGYQGSNTKGSINVSGNSATLTIKAQGIMNYLWILIIAVVIIIALTIGIILLRKVKNKRGVKEWKEHPKQN
ncbi:MAG: DUF2341 domain-containing protein [Candidatus Nanopusillus acidilobi]